MELEKLGWAATRGLLAFRRLPRHCRRIVFYAEDSQSWVHFEHIIHELTAVQKTPICYVTSSQNDPMLSASNPLITPFFIGRSTVRTLFFSFLDADICVMTVPDLQTYQLKRSLIAPVHYCYVFHSIVSTHMAYREGALDHFDSILCVGPHHEREIREREQSRNLKKKKLFQCGYGRIDSMLRNRCSVVSERYKSVLIAPSHGPQSIIENCADILVSVLVSAGYYVTLRPHPVSLKESRKKIAVLQKLYGGSPYFKLETDVRSFLSLQLSSVMISDWSGAALEYALALEKPVLFIDVPRKVNNRCYKEISTEPVEVSLRTRVGEVVSLGDLGRIPDIIAGWQLRSQAIRTELASLRSEFVFNVGTSGFAGACSILSVLAGIINKDFAPVELQQAARRL